MNKNKTMNKNTSNKANNSRLPKNDINLSFINIKLKREDAENMISTYEFLAWQNEGDERKFCKKILKSLKKALEYNFTK